MGAREIAQWLTVCSVLAETQSLVPSTDFWQPGSQLPATPVPGIPFSLLASLDPVLTCTDAQSYTHN